jgi:serine/threonine protein kinase
MVPNVQNLYLDTMTEKDFFDRFAYDPKKDVLGTGALGTTYKVYDRKENRFVALKVARVRDDRGTFSLADEVHMSRQLDYHAHVARYEFVFRVEEPVPTDYAVMDFYEDGHLDDFLRKNMGAMTDTEIRLILEGILQGMKHLHREGVILKTLHPADILMHRSRAGLPVPKIAAFGLRQFRVPDATNAVFFPDIQIPSEYPYVAPELLTNQSARYQSDTWSFGSIACRILTGEIAFAAPYNMPMSEAIVEIKRKILKAELPSSFQSIAPNYQQLLLKCWEPSLETRAKSVDELLEILQHSNVTIKVIPPFVEASVIEKIDNELVMPEIPQNNRGISTSIMAILISLAVLSWFWFYKSPSVNQPNEILLIDKARTGGTLPAWRFYLKRFPEGNYVAEAHRMVDSLTDLKDKYMKNAKIMMKGEERNMAKQDYENILRIDPQDASAKQVLETLRTEL